MTRFLRERGFSLPAEHSVHNENPQRARPQTSSCPYPTSLLPPHLPQISSSLKAHQTCLCLPAPHPHHVKLSPYQRHLCTGGLHPHHHSATCHPQTEPAPPVCTHLLHQPAARQTPPWVAQRSRMSHVEGGLWHMGGTQIDRENPARSVHPTLTNLH